MTPVSTPRNSDDATPVSEVCSPRVIAVGVTPGPLAVLPLVAVPALPPLSAVVALELFPDELPHAVAAMAITPNPVTASFIVARRIQISLHPEKSYRGKRGKLPPSSLQQMQ